MKKKLLILSTLLFSLSSCEIEIMLNSSLSSINENQSIESIDSFSSDKNIVANLGASEIKGFKSSNIISVAKHFPGHGDTDIDSHYKLPIINKTLHTPL